MKACGARCSLALLMLVLLTGCPSEDPSAGSPAIVEEPPLVVASWDEVQKMVAAHQGKVVVLDLWSTWCLPCMREFPHLVEIHEQFPQDVACISVNLNYIGLEEESAESMREQVMPFLKSRSAFFENVISSDPDNVVMEKISLASIPAVMVFGRDGQLIKRFDNDQGLYGEGFTYQDHVLPLVKQAILTNL
jgi:thiol-disulfide isomerase/thioredoxin